MCQYVWVRCLGGYRDQGKGDIFCKLYDSLVWSCVTVMCKLIEVDCCMGSVTILAAVFKPAIWVKTTLFTAGVQVAVVVIA